MSTTINFIQISAAAVRQNMSASETSWGQHLFPWLGPVVVAAIVTMVGQHLINRWKQVQDRKGDEQRAWTKIAMPAQEAADDLIARFFDILVRKRTLSVPNLSFANLADVPFPNNPGLELTTTFRLIKFFAGVTYLQRQLPNSGDVMRLRQADLYVSNKVRMALKGNITGSTLKLPTETQQCIGAKFLESVPGNSPHEFDFYRFITTLRTDSEARAIAELASAVLAFEGNIQDPTPELISLVVAVIYLIDFHQDLLSSSKWEEFRLLLVSVVREWNTSPTNRRVIYLYSHADLATKNYFDSYARLDFLNHKIESKRQKIRRLTKRQSNGRTIKTEGLTKNTKTGKIEFYYPAKPDAILNRLKQIIS